MAKRVLGTVKGKVVKFGTEDGVTPMPDQPLTVVLDEPNGDQPYDMTKEGFGETKLEALAEFAKDLGLRATKTWGRTFADFVSEA